MDYPPFPIPYRPAAARHTHMPLRAPEAGDGGAGSASEGGEEGIRSKTEAGAGEVRVDRESIERQVFSAGLPILVGIGLALWGMWETRSIVNPVTVLANSADLAAIHWVEDKTPAEARFFINSTPWMGEVYRGVDGGYWLLPLAGRFAIVPPLAAGWGERQDATRLNQWAKRASEVSDCDERFWSLVGDSRLDYAYLRQGEGSLTPAILDRCDGARRVYSQGGVYIYTLSSK